jgi:hypothetical protein
VRSDFSFKRLRGEAGYFWEPKFINYFTPSKGKLHQMCGIRFWTKDGSHFGNFNIARYFWEKLIVLN